MGSNNPSVSRRLACLVIPLIWLQTSLLWCVLVLLPSLVLLIFPCASARRTFSWIGGRVQAAWLGFAVFCLRYGLGVRMVVHTRNQAALSELSVKRDVLISCNHRTRIDWMFLWALAAAMGQLSSLKIVLKSSLRKVPGVGWACQCFGFAFMQRSDTDTDIETLRRTAAMHCIDRANGDPAILLFPEGTDLSEDNQRKDNAFADRQRLTRYTQVLHPRTAGFRATLDAIGQYSREPPSVLDVTIAYHDYEPGERPSEISVFLKGRCCREVHFYCEFLEAPLATAALCERLFAEKEVRLSKFYAPCSAGGAPDVAALAGTIRACTSKTLESIPGVQGSMLRGLVFFVLLELAVAAIIYQIGVLRSAVGFIVSCLIFSCISRVSGGVDRLLLWHAHRHPFRANSVGSPLL